MNILLLTKFYPPDTDGVGDHSFHLKKHLERQQPSINVFLATSENSERYLPADRLYPFRYWNKREFQGLRRFIESNRIGKILVQYVPYSFNRYGVPLRFLFLLKNAVPENAELNFIIHESRIRIIPWQKYAVIGIGQALALKIIYSIAARIITSNPLYSKLIHKVDPQRKIHIIPVGSNINSGETAALDRRSTEHFTICSFGRSFTSAAEILQAVKRASNSIPNLRMIFIGSIRSGERKAIFRHAQALGIAESVQMTGRISTGEIRRMLHDADLYIMREGPCINQWRGTSLRNGTLAAALEAGLPVIGYRGAITNIQLLNLRFITLLQEYDSREIAAGILDYFNSSREEKLRLKESARAFFKKNLTWEVIAKAYVNVLTPRQSEYA